MQSGSDSDVIVGALLFPANTGMSSLLKKKPRSSITEWVDILTSSSYDDEVYDGIPELIHSIDLQASGPAEASRAIRKKIKHGNTHQQYRALVILNALVENCGSKFHGSFADGQLTDALKHLATDYTTDPKVRKKVLAVLASWSRQFKDDRGAAGIAGLYRQVKPAGSEGNREALAERERESEKRRKEKVEAKRKAKEKRLEEARSKKAASRTATSRKQFNFEQEKPQVLTAIANASSAANNLVNAITLVNTENDSLVSNERVQECLVRAKQSRKIIIRYIQLVENEEVIGTLIESNERIIAALESYDKLTKPNVTEKDVEDVQQGLEAAHIAGSEVQRLQEKQRAAVQRAVRERPRVDDSPRSPIHPDLQDLSFGELGAEQRNLPPPIRPNTRGSSHEENEYGRASLSDFSDYESSDEGTYGAAGQSSSSNARKPYVNVSDDDSDEVEEEHARRHIIENEDPFADPFGD